jgi:integrase/recombinase XerD
VHLAERGHNPGGVRNIYGAVKALVNWYASEHEGWPNPLRKVRNPKAPDVPLHPVDLGDLQKMLDTCARRTFAGDRDRALLLFLLDSGVRHQELCDLDVADVDAKTGLVLVRRGKGRKARTTVIGTKTRKALTAYLRHRKDNDPALWVTREGTRLSYAGIRQVLRRRAGKAGVREPSLHSFRRAFALNCLRNGCDVYSLQRMMGHADLGILRRYLDQDPTDLQMAHEKAGPVDRLLH